MRVLWSLNKRDEPVVCFLRVTTKVQSLPMATRMLAIARRIKFGWATRIRLSLSDSLARGHFVVRRIGWHEVRSAGERCQNEGRLGRRS